MVASLTMVPVVDEFEQPLSNASVFPAGTVIGVVPPNEPPTLSVSVGSDTGLVELTLP